MVIFMVIFMVILWWFNGDIYVDIYGDLMVI